MRVHSIEKIQKLKKLRRKGYSINELVDKLSIPKTTIWHHVQDVEILPKYAAILKSKRGGSAKRKQKKIEEAKQYAQELLQAPERELAVALAMLYWSEGHKKACDFINSDGIMIKGYLVILKKLFGISKNDLRLTLRIFTGMDQTKCLNYWSNITKIPKHEFKIRFNDGGTSGRTKYGMCRVTVRKGSDVLKIIHSLIKQVSEEIIKNPKLKNRKYPRSSVDQSSSVLRRRPGVQILSGVQKMVNKKHKTDTV